MNTLTSHNLTADTSLALMQASQADVSAKASALKKQATENGLSDKENAQLNAVAKDFEAMFMAEMMKPVFNSIKPDARFGGGKGEEIFKGLLLQEYTKMMAETGQLGIADMVKTELIRMQGEAQNLTPQGDK
ncbi:MAG: rod-binding protein [Alphaproteobacteria bacterium]|nr:rod-binding protein [Alphaproteobacteria bacterium]